MWRSVLVFLLLGAISCSETKKQRAPKTVVRHQEGFEATTQNDHIPKELEFEVVEEPTSEVVLNTPHVEVGVGSVPPLDPPAGFAPDAIYPPPPLVPPAPLIPPPPSFHDDDDFDSGRKPHHKDRLVNGFTPFVPNSYKFWTRPEVATTFLEPGCTGPGCSCIPEEPNCEGLAAFADIVVDPSNFVWCKGGPYALCYYSGPFDENATDTSCRLTEDGKFATCKCYEIPYGTYFVDINAILNYGVYQQTLKVCGFDGALCSGAENINKAPVCQAINDNNFIPGSDMISTFSFDCAQTEGFGQTNCPNSLYAGCMTASCQRRDNVEGIVDCLCPTYEGPFQVGAALQNPEEDCPLGDDLVWSAAFAPSVKTIPPLDPCIPDLPGNSGCPLVSNSIPEPPPGTDCDVICDAYACMNDAGIEPGFACDSVLCTASCNARDLVQEVCPDLKQCPKEGTEAIIALSAELECSCCASQVCNCQANEATKSKIFDLNQAQRDLGITPQCDLNGTLCGES